MTPSFDDYFTFDKILTGLCKLRAKRSKKLHDNQFHQNIFSNVPTDRRILEHDIFKCMPPRRQWCRLSKANRKKYRLSSIDIAERELFFTVKKLIRKHKNLTVDKPKWLENLTLLINNIHGNALSMDFRFKKPKVYAAPKDISKNEYRPIAIYTIEDSIIQKQAAKYFMELFDVYFLDCSYAFRKNKLHAVHGKTFNHHSTIKEIYSYWIRNKKRPLYAAESDLSKFYDTLNHEIILECLRQFTMEYRISVNQAAMSLLLSYLDSYTFNKYAIFSNPGKIFPWISESEFYEIYHPDSCVNIGIPQGGALSVFLANLVLHYADIAVYYPWFFKKFYVYCRFCDDIVIVARYKLISDILLHFYNNKIKKLKLFTHKPEQIKHYSKDFWKVKSKSSYKWGNKQEGGVPWLSFVGYQLHYTGLIRIRKQSIAKEIKKIKTELKITIKYFLQAKKVLKISRNALIFRFRNRLLSMSVGRVNQYKNLDNSFSWAGGFELMRQIPFVSSQIKSLDFTRNKSISTLHYVVKDSIENKQKGIKKVKSPRYYGKSYSYYGQFEN